MNKCSSQGPNHPLFLQIVEEHKQFRDQLLRLTSSSSVSELQTLFEQYEKHHHYKEEVYLFSNLIDNPLLCEGGPLCVYY